MQLITITTLGDLIDRGYRLNAGRRQWRHSAGLDLDALALKRGRDYHPYDKIRPYCSRCGSREIAVTLHAR